MQKQVSFYRDRLDSLRVPVGADEVNSPARVMRFLVIDDDVSFLKIMERAARVKGISVTLCVNSAEAKTLAQEPFDAVVVDFMLGEENGVDAASMWEDSSREIPIILVSQTDRVPAPNRWPGGLREFVHKRLGAFAILEAAVEAVEISDMQKSMHCFS
jgi:DNA-binding NtrC family response regulator